MSERDPSIRRAVAAYTLVEVMITVGVMSLTGAAIFSGLNASMIMFAKNTAVNISHQAGRSAIGLVPEIALTAQVVEIFTGRFGEQVAVLHSKLSEGERHDEWRRMQDGKARIVVGARSGPGHADSDGGRAG